MVILQKERSENSRSYAVRVLLYNIIHLELQPGTAVSENELSTTLSLSRTPVREALIELNRIGLVEILPQRGSYISKIDYNIVEESRFLRLVTENAKCGLTILSRNRWFTLTVSAPFPQNQSNTIMY